jgi:hypothetical protein
VLDVWRFVLTAFDSVSSASACRLDVVFTFNERETGAFVECNNKCSFVFQYKSLQGISQSGEGNSG